MLTIRSWDHGNALKELYDLSFGAYHPHRPCDSLRHGRTTKQVGDAGPGMERDRQEHIQ